MDPLADKVLVLAAMCFLVERGQMPGWMLSVILFREFTVSGLRLVAAERQHSSPPPGPARSRPPVP